MRYSALVPNLQGLKKAVECEVDEIAVFVAASEDFSQANIDCSIEESLRRSEEVVKAAQRTRHSCSRLRFVRYGMPFCRPCRLRRCSSRD